MQITICGGGNAAHALASLIAARGDWVVNVYTPYADEAQRWRQGVAARGGIAAVTPDDTLVGRPARVSANPAEVVPGSRLVLLALPAFAHEAMLRAIAPHLDPEARIGALPARGGFDWCVSNVLRGQGSGGAGERGRVSSPRSVRIADVAVGVPADDVTYGQEVEILGRKVTVDMAAQPLDEWARRSYAGDITDPSTLQSCFATNRSYAGLRAPMRSIADELVPDFKARYLAEDVPFGLIVTRGFAELADVPTPMMDQVIIRSEERLERECLVNGRLQGKNVAVTRAPQRYGFETLDGLDHQGR